MKTSEPKSHDQNIHITVQCDIPSSCRAEQVCLSDWGVKANKQILL